MTYKNEPWFRVLTGAVEAYNRASPNGRGGVNSVAEQLGVSRSQVSSVINGPYGASTDHLAKKVMAILDRWHCPYLNTDITAEECRGVHTGQTPSHDPMRLAHRRMCRTCDRNTTNTTNTQPKD
jgi:hypothetical protein